MNPYMNQQAAQMIAAQAAATAGRYRGKIRFFNEAKGFGFIECPEAFAAYKRDVFLHKADFQGFTVGQDVTFKVDLNKEGMPQAREVKAGIPGSTPTVDTKGGKGGKGKGTPRKAKGSGKG